MRNPHSTKWPGGIGYLPHTVAIIGLSGFYFQIKREWHGTINNPGVLELIISPRDPLTDGLIVWTGAARFDGSTRIPAGYCFPQLTTGQQIFVATDRFLSDSITGKWAVANTSTRDNSRNRQYPTHWGGQTPLSTQLYGFPVAPAAPLLRNCNGQQKVPWGY